MVISEVNGKKHAETNREEKLRFLSAMRTVIEFIMDIESAEKGWVHPIGAVPEVLS